MTGRSVANARVMPQAVFCGRRATCDPVRRAMPATGPIGLAAPGAAHYVEGTGA
ncbi:hypothetical protein A3768_4301 (plasmid) [Ralstonia solanacearum]|nr:hypothetical protein A3768_4301 [Ralstonia solanacearum]